MSRSCGNTPPDRLERNLIADAPSSLTDAGAQRPAFAGIAMEAKMGLKTITPTVSKADLAHLGEGEVGYIRKMKADEVSRVFPEAPEIDPSLDLWALFGADGTPILLTDNRSSTFYKAAEDDLRTVSLH
jgi:hypothetical protein